MHPTFIDLESNLHQRGVEFVISRTGIRQMTHSGIAAFNGKERA